MIDVIIFFIIIFVLMVSTIIFLAENKDNFDNTDMNVNEQLQFDENILVYAIIFLSSIGYCIGYLLIQLV